MSTVTASTTYYATFGAASFHLTGTSNGINSDIPLR